MAKRVLLLLLITLSLCGLTNAQTYKTIDGKDFSFSTSKPARGFVLFFLLPDCPMCQNYSLTINKLCKEYENKGFSFILVFPGKAYSNKEISDFLRSYKIAAKAVLDPALSLADKLKATVTPQAFLLSPDSKVLYDGRIDNWMYSVGQRRKTITVHYLDDALKAVLENHSPATTHTEPVGCFIR